MRLTLSATLGAALLVGPAFAQDYRHGDGPPPPYADVPPGYGYDHGYGALADPRWERLHQDWVERCRNDRRDRDGDRAGPHAGCNGLGYPPYPGAYMGYAMPMVMVPVLRSKPCREEVEEITEEVVPVRQRLIRPRPRIVPDKRVPMTPSKRIPY